MELRNPYIFDPNRVVRPNTFKIVLARHNIKKRLFWGRQLVGNINGRTRRSRQQLSRLFKGK